MASLIVAGDTSGTVTLQAPDVSGSTVLTLPTTSGTIVTTGGGASVPFAAGSAASPSITFTGDTNTGIFSPGADTIAFSEGGVEAMRIDSSGNVGIGTSSPSWKLDVNGQAKLQDTLIDTGSIEVGTFGTGDRFSLIDFHSSGTPTTIDNSARLLRYPGVNGSFEISNSGTGSMLFLNNNAERMRINSSGDLLVGTTSNLGKVVINGVSGTQSAGLYVTNFGDGIGYGAMFRLSPSASGGLGRLFFQNASDSTVGQITISATSTAYVTSSDYRLKENIAPMTGALARVSALKPVTYSWKVDGSDGQGFIAHELQEVVPECVTGEKDAVETYLDEDGVEQTRPVYQGIDTSFLVATLTSAIQEQQAIIQSQADTITAMEARLTALENK